MSLSVLYPLLSFLPKLLVLYLLNMPYTPFDFKNKRHQWASFLKTIRIFLEENQYTEVFTPSLVDVGAFESTIDTLKVKYSTGTCELHSSPEIEMKAVLSEFPHPIYQICKCFRDDPESNIHAKEFTMLEFYRPGASSAQIEKETLSLFSRLAGITISAHTFSIYELVQNLTGINLEEHSSLNSFAQELKTKTTVHFTKEDSWADLFFKLMIEVVEPALPKNSFCVINQYPISVSPLSQPIPGTTKAERFEIYFNGIELCNGCTELTDELALKKRYAEESDQRLNSSKLPHPPPIKLFESALHAKNYSGVAIGLERMFFVIESLKT